MSTPHYIGRTLDRVPRPAELAAMTGVCGAVYTHCFSFSDVQSIIDCPACRDWIRKNEPNKGKLALVEAAWAHRDELAAKAR